MATWRTNKVILFARSIARKIGLTRLVGALRGQKEYEDRFARSMQELVQPGDIVWDIGANHGYYSKKFLQWVGDTGKVYAFEPSPRNQLKFREKVGETDQIILVPVALSNRTGTTQFLEIPGQGTASHILDSEEGDSVGQHKTTVDISTGDEAVQQGRVEAPNFIKIDTEGHEWEVLDGMKDLLKNKSVECLCIEVHFRILQERGLSHAPGDIEQLLNDRGFYAEWCDASHIIAKRGR